MASYQVAGQLTDLPDHINRILLQVIKDDFPNPFITSNFENNVNLTHYDYDTETGDIRFEIDDYMENTDYQISVLDDRNNEGSKTKQSLGTNSLWEFIYRPTIHIWVRQVTFTRPREIDDFKEKIDTLITARENSMPHGIDRIWCDLPQEFIEREFESTEDEAVNIITTWHVIIPTSIRVFKWWVTS
jgi:hypothetical protein